MAPRLLLCTDMDRTLLPNGAQPESEGARELFRRLVSLPGVALAYVTGRHRQLVLDAIDEFDVPLPDYVIGDVGSTIYEVADTGWRHWDQWEAAIDGDWNGQSRERLAGLLSGVPQLQIQEPEKQNTHKLSYYAPPDCDEQSLVSDVHRRLAEEGIKASLIWSIDEAADTGLLDVLPASASKRHAIEFMMQHLGYGLEETVFSGDSGNDLAVLASPVQAVVVANASDVLKSQARELSAAAGCADALYIATGGAFGMNGNYSAGIVEGVCHYRPEFEALLRAGE